MTTAILIDGAFFIKRIRYFEKDSAYDAKRMATLGAVYNSLIAVTKP